MTMFALVKSENTSLLMLGTYLKLQWIPCVLEVVGLVLSVTQICIPVRAFAVMVALIGFISDVLD